MEIVIGESYQTSINKEDTYLCILNTDINIYNTKEELFILFTKNIINDLKINIKKYVEQEVLSKLESELNEINLDLDLHLKYICYPMLSEFYDILEENDIKKIVLNKKKLKEVEPELYDTFIQEDIFNEEKLKSLEFISNKIINCYILIDPNINYFSDFILTDYDIQEYQDNKNDYIHQLTLIQKKKLRTNINILIKKLIDKYKIKEIKKENILHEYKHILDTEVIEQYISNIDKEYKQNHKVISDNIFSNNLRLSYSDNKDMSKCIITNDIRQPGLLKYYLNFYDLISQINKLKIKYDYFYVFRGEELQQSEYCRNLENYIKKFKNHEKVIINFPNVISTAYRTEWLFGDEDGGWDKTNIFYIIKVKNNEQFLILENQTQSEITLAPGSFTLTNIFYYKKIDNKIILEVEYNSFSRTNVIKFLRSYVPKTHNLETYNFNTILEETSMIGGYYLKYIKYKTKYLELKNKLN